MAENEKNAGARMKAYVNMSDYSVEERNKRALSDLVWRVMENETGRPFDLVDFLAEQKDLAEIISMTFHATTENPIANWMWRIESRLRAKLEGSEAVERRAEELAQEE